MRLRLAFAFALSAATLGCVGYKNQVLVGQTSMRLRHTTLPSGARVILEEAPGTGTASVVLMIGAGSSADPVGKEGLAHLVEHLGFRSKPKGNVTLMQSYELLGVSYVNAETHFDDTRLQLLGPARLAPMMIALAAQQLAHPIENIEPRVFAVERDVVLSEQIETAEHGLEGEAVTTLQRALFPAEHRFARPLAGTTATVSPLTLEDAQAWAAEHYLPSRATLVVVGDFDSAAMEPVLLSALPDEWKQAPPGPLPAKIRSFGIPPSPPPTSPTVPVVHAATDRSTLVLAWSLPASWTLVASHEFLASRVQAHLSFSLNPRSAELGRPSCQIVPGPEVSFLFCRVQLVTGLHVEDSLNELSGRLAHTWDRSVRLRQMSVAEAYINQLFHEENLLSRASERAEAMHFADDPFALTKRLDQLRRLDETALTQIGREYLTRDRMRAVLIEPLDAHAPLVARSSGVGARPLEVQVPKEAVREEAEGPNLTGMRSFTLSNGLPVLVVPRPAMPVAAVVLAVPGGTARGARGAAFLSELYSTLDAEAGLLAGDTSVVQQPDVTMIRFIGANGNLEALLDNAHAWLQIERGSQTIDNARERLDKRLQKIQLDADFHASDAFIDAVYRGSRASPVLERDVLSKLSLDDSEAWRHAALQPARSALVITGDIDPEAARHLAEKHLSGWSSEPAQLPLPTPIPLEVKPTVVQVNARPKSAVVTLMLGCLLPVTEPKLSLAPMVLATLLRTRLERLWRTELGISYGVHERVEVNDAASALFIESQLDPRRLTTVLRTLKQQWDELELPEHDVELARWETARERSAIGTTSVELAEFLAAPAVRTHSVLGAIEQEHQLAELPGELLQKEFDVCKGTTVLRLDGDEELIRKALHDAGQ